ncbi:induced myeloid leukemia cell differentiation protein Mcl-1b [Thalassophryne amazonica]|uniref:induced myeloid leukemia cell differentiation protein Mcl-1b n=1 Tax=Thalassophryne amazonica TaxID=390379 RepID=UPI001470DBD2|nr:induced myeloid leukemia cell differentiation protein Mcl-1b [Thalassophryne amazonica]
MNIITRSKRLRMSEPDWKLILPANGPVETARDYSPDSSPQISAASDMDSLNGNVTPNGAQKRPKRLGMNTENGYPAKNSQDDGGSLPCTPELQSDSEIDATSPAGGAVLESDTRQLIDSFLHEFTGLSQPRWKQTSELETMKRVAENLLEKHTYVYRGMISKLSLDDRGDDMSFITAVATSIFADGKTNWGRIASLVTFGGVVSQYLKDKGRGHCVDLVGQEISTYLLSAQRNWLIQNNAWEGFVEFFRVSDPESTVRNVLMTCVGVAGIGATLALLIR